MKKTIGIFIGFAVILGCAGVEFGFCQSRDTEEVRTLKEEIQIINLLNSLDLKREQMEYIIQKATEANEIRKGVREKFSANKERLVESYSAIKEDVAQGRVNLGGREKRGFHKLHNETEDVLASAYDRIDTIAKSVENQLESYQLVALDNYKPCIIPKMQEGRIGQADPSTGMIKILERVKNLPQERYLEKREELIEKITGHITQRKYLGIELNEAQINAKISEIFEEARSMDEADFMIKKESLAKKLTDEIIPAKKQVPRTEKIKKFLLTDKIITILEERLSKRA